MSYQFRNRLVLGILLGLTTAVFGFLNLWHYPQKIEKLNSRAKELEKQISALEGIDKEFYRIQEEIEKQQEKLKKLDKQIMQEIQPAQTYAYLNDILKYSGLVQFNLYYVEEKDVDKYHATIYRLKGESFYPQIYRFINLIERGPQIYRINRLKMSVSEQIDPKTKKYKALIPFEMELWALSAGVTELPHIQRTLADVGLKRTTNPFYPLIKGYLPPNRDNLVEVERSELKAVLPDRIMITDQLGEIKILKPGDKVYLGYLSKINQAENKAEFIINKGGLVEKIELSLRNDKKVRGKL